MFVSFEGNRQHMAKVCVYSSHRRLQHWCLRWIWLLLRPGRATGYYDQFVCLCVCLSVREHVSGTAGLTFTKCLCRSPWPWRCNSGAESDVYERLVALVAVIYAALHVTRSRILVCGITISYYSTENTHTTADLHLLLMLKLY